MINYHNLPEEVKSQLIEMGYSPIFTPGESVESTINSVVNNGGNSIEIFRLMNTYLLKLLEQGFLNVDSISVSGNHTLSALIEEEETLLLPNAA